MCCAEGQPQQIEAIPGKDMTGQRGNALGGCEQVAAHPAKCLEGWGAEHLVHCRRTAERSLEVAAGSVWPRPSRQNDAISELPAGDCQAAQLLRLTGLVRIDQQHPNARAADAFPDRRRRGKLVRVTNPLLAMRPLQGVVEPVVGYFSPRVERRVGAGGEVRGRCFEAVMGPSTKELADYR